MKIGIMTTHSALNCGAVLQAYALQTYLEKLGHEVEFIDYRGKNKRTFRDFIGKGLLKTWYKWQDNYNFWKYKKNGTFGMILKKGQPTYYSHSELQNNPPPYDVYIAGSDQIWNIGASAKSINRHNYLDFGNKNIKRIAFAASLGQCKVPNYFEDEIRLLLLNFDAISIREENGATFVRSLVGDRKVVKQIADPTILLKASDYLKIAKKINSKNNYIASYILAQLEDDHIKIINYIKAKTNFKIINLRNPNTCIRLKHAKKNKIVTPYQWLSYVYNSSLVICCSFHAVIFSLIFHKPFVVITPYANERINSILNPLGLNEHIVTEFDPNHISYLLQKNIEWDKIDKSIDLEKQRSIAFLKEHLK